MNEERKDPETADEFYDEIWHESVSKVGRVFNTKLFWIPGLLSGFSGIALCLLLVPGEPPVKLLAGMVSFLVLWIGVGTASSMLFRRD